MNRQPKKKVDREALTSPLMRIPRMDIAATRELIDLGIRQIYDLQGRAPEALFDEAKLQKPGILHDHLRFFRMAVYYAENEGNLDPAKLQPGYWA